MVPSKNHTLFQTNMGKVYTRLQTKIAQNPYSLGAAHTVEPRCNEGPRDWKNVFAITRFRYIEVLFHIFSYYWGKENRSLYRGLRYIEVRYIEVPLHLYGFYKGVHSSPSPLFWERELSAISVYSILGKKKHGRFFYINQQRSHSTCGYQDWLLQR